ncbi:MAG: cytochrome P460 family protein [Cyanobacteria bacterium J06635_1]
MARPKWISGLVLFSISVGVAIALTHLTSSGPLPELSAGYTQSPPVSGPEAIYSPNLEDSDDSLVQFPANYQQQFVHYATVDCPNSSIVRQMYVNRPALDTLKTSETVPSGTVIVMETHSARQGSHGRLTPTRLNNVFIREKRSGWQVNADSGEWQSAWYSPSGDLVSNSQGSCIGCHTRVRDSHPERFYQRDYLFTLPALLTAANTEQLQHQTTEFGTSVCR